MPQPAGTALTEMLFKEWLFKTLVTHSYPLELCSSTMYPTLFAITTNTMCKAQQGGSLFKTQDNTKDFASINTFTFSHGPMYV